MSQKYTDQDIILWIEYFENLGSIRAVARHIKKERNNIGPVPQTISKHLKNYFKKINKNYLQWYNNFTKIKKIVLCENCNLKFTPNGYVQRFCSKKCQRNNTYKLNKDTIKNNKNDYFKKKRARRLRFFSYSKNISNEIIKISLFLEQESKINDETKGNYFDYIVSIEKKLKWVFSQNNILKYFKSKEFIDLSLRTKSMYSRVLSKYLEWTGHRLIVPKIIDSKYTFIEEFIDQNCLIGEGNMILQKFLIESINNFYQKLIIPKENCGGLTQFLVKYDVSTVGNSLNRRKYIGITLNSEGLKHLNNITSNRELNRMKLRKQQNLTKSNICKYISCNPCVQELERTVIAYNNQVTLESDRIDFLRSKKILKNIEMLLFKMNIFRKSQVKIALAIYLTSDYRKDFIAKFIIKSSFTSINSLEKLIKNHFPSKWQWLNKYNDEKKTRHYSDFELASPKGLDS